MEKRIVFKPNFKAQVDLRQAIGEEVAQRAKWARMSYQNYYKKHPRAVQLIAKRLVAGRTGGAKHNTSQFFKNLYCAMFGGEVKHDVFDGSGFHPDVTEESDQRVVHTEIKAVSRRNGAPLVTCYQFVNYCEDFFRMAKNGTESSGINYAVFRYGDTQVTEKLYTYDHKGLAKRLGESINDLLIIPLNVLIPLLLSHSLVELNHATSTSSRDAELYWRPGGKDFTRIHESHDRVKELFDESDKKGISGKVLCSDNLEREEFESPGNIYCGRYKVKPFRVTRYANKDLERWARSFVKNQAHIFMEFGLGCDFNSYSLLPNQEESDDIPF